MKAEVEKIFKLCEELEEAGETATLTFLIRGGMSTCEASASGLIFNSIFTFNIDFNLGPSSCSVSLNSSRGHRVT